MEKKNYNSPCMDQVEIMPEACIAASAAESAEVQGVNPAPWEEGNTNWW